MFSRFAKSGFSVIRQQSMATSAAKAPVQIPLTLHGLDGRYATALFSAASKAGQLDAVEQEIKRIHSAVNKDKKLLDFLNNPVLSREDKKQGVQIMLSQGGKYSDLTKNFFELLAENRRLDETMKIVDGFQQLMAAHRGEVTVNVISAKPLDAKMQTQLKNVISKSNLLKKGQTLRIASKVNPSLIGGMIVEVGDKSIDLSIASRLAKLNKLVTEAI